MFFNLIAGVHLEGPFINPMKKGAHPEHLMRTVSGISDVEKVYGSLENAVIITMAPEIEGNTHVFEEIVQRGIVVSIGEEFSYLLWTPGLPPFLFYLNITLASTSQSVY